ncbi:hypothetical protein ZIOFF_013610 [Zingiber officinale]|uniref:IP5PC-F beta-propeller domain-containing protein n=1 Tax=Zingiber officinale TaxID=94328 RepID=A0A8J5HBV9_ZINOF|nr:hypothetical protein ZIOFF_013610 [Zingiber officinale]
MFSLALLPSSARSALAQSSHITRPLILMLQESMTSVVRKPGPGKPKVELEATGEGRVDDGWRGRRSGRGPPSSPLLLPLVDSPMEEKKDEEDAAGDLVARPPYRKGISYSQPFNLDAFLPGAARRNATRKQNLGGDDPTTRRHCYTSDESAPCSSGNSSRRTNRRHQSASLEETGFHPPPPPTQSLHASLGGSFGNHHCDDSDGDGTLTLDRAMFEFGGSPGTVPEFMGSGGGVGIFRVPARAAMHTGRPPALEVRPHPLRETQAGSFLRIIACVGSQLWAGQESGLRVWNLKSVFENWEPGVMARKGDEKSAPFNESCRASPTLCLAVDAANGLIWSGHKDGKIRSWKMELPFAASDDPVSGSTAAASNSGCGGCLPFREGLSWQAHHRSPVRSMVITSYGTSLPYQVYLYNLSCFSLVRNISCH